MTTATSDPPTAPLSSVWSALPPEYAIPDHAPSEADAREYCRRLARSHYENFSVASWFLPERLRQHFFNVYAYCRISAVARSMGDGIKCVLRRSSYSTAASRICRARRDRTQVRNSET